MMTLLQQTFRRFGAAMALGAIAFLISACSPQNATQEQAMYRSTSSNGYAAATDVQKNNEARHFVVFECVPASGCSLVHWRKTASDERNVVVTTGGSSVIEMIDVAAADDGSAVVTWLQRDGSDRVPKYAIVSDAGSVSGPFDLGLPGHAFTDVSLQRSPLVVASGGGAVYAAYISGATGTHKLWYRQLLPSASVPALVQDVASFGGDGYISGPVVKVDPVGNAHIAWRYVKFSNFSAVGYARITTPGVPATVQEVELEALGASATLSEPDLVLDIATATPKAHVAYKRLNGSAESALAVARYDNAVFQTTRVISLTNADGWTMGGGVDRPSLALYGSAPAVAFTARRVPADASFYAYLWKGSGIPERVSAVGGLTSRDVLAVSIGSTAAPLPLVVYKVVTTTAGASGLYVYDSIYDRTITVANDPFCSAGYCLQNLDVTAHGGTVSGVWLAKKEGSSVFRAYEARNDNTPQGYLPVTSLADSNLADGNLTLREAMMVANGTLTSGFSVSERSLLETGGCIFNGSGAIIGGCGANITDTVTITPGLAGTITLQTGFGLGALPVISDTQPTLLIGPSSLRADVLDTGVTIDGRNVAGLDAIFKVTSSRNQLSNWKMINAERGVHVMGHDNELVFMTAYSHTVAAFDIDGGDRNLLIYAIAVLPAAFESCDGGDNTIGMVMHSGAQSNTVGTAALTCATQYGLILDGVDTTRNFFGDVYLGGIRPTAPGNGLGGGLIRNGANGNQLLDGRYIGNTGPGLTLLNAGFNVVNGGMVVSNTGPGILIDGASTGNAISGTLMVGNAVGIQQSSVGANFWSRMAVYSNTGLGIDVGALGAVDAPSITFTGYNPLTGEISGTLNYGGAPVAATVEIFAALPDASGYGEALQPLGIVGSVTSNGSWSLTALSGYACVTAVVSLPTGSSEFSQVYCRYPLMLPLVVR